MLDLRDLRIPVIGAPMAGGPSTPALAAAVSDAGGLGFLAAGYRGSDRMAAEVEQVRAATGAPVGVNLFVIAPYEPDAEAVARYRRALATDAARLGVELGRPTWDDDQWQAKLDAILDLRPDAVSFTFGCPTPDLLHTLARQDILTTVTVTSVAEAREAVARGAASLAVQGPEAGGHRGTWDLETEPDPTPLLDLVSAVVAEVDVPVAAGGGLATADDVASTLRRGAAAAQVGTAYLLAHEAGTDPVHRGALVDPASTTTAVTRAYTGRWARGVANRFMADHTDAPPGYPHLHHLTAPLRAAALAAGDAQTAHLWAGTRFAAARSASAEAITASLAP